MFKLLKIFLLCIIAGISLFFIGYVFLQHNSGSTSLQVFSQYHWAFTFWHIGCYTLALTLWPYFIKFVGQRQKWPPSVILYWTKQRLKLTGFFILIEVLFMVNLFGHLFAWL